jgi:DNA-binding MarR family transcriptional regulator
MAHAEATEAANIHLAEGLYRSLSKLFQMLRRGDPNSTTGDLTLAQITTLVTLLTEGPVRMSCLAAHERVRTPTTTVAVRRLEKSGLVKRSRDPADLRAVLVEITEAGRAMLDESLTIRRAGLAAMLSELPPSDLDILMDAMPALDHLACCEPGGEAVDASPGRNHS